MDVPAPRTWSLPSTRSHRLARLSESCLVGCHCPRKPACSRHSSDSDFGTDRSHNSWKEIVPILRVDHVCRTTIFMKDMIGQEENRLLTTHCTIRYGSCTEDETCCCENQINDRPTRRYTCPLLLHFLFPWWQFQIHHLQG